MTLDKVLRAFGGLALLGPLAVAAWAEQPAGQSAIRIYNSNEVVKYAATQDKGGEQAVPKSTESKEAAPANGQAAAADEGGVLQQHMRCGPLGSWLDCNRVKVSGHVEVGFTYNPDDPDDRLTMGRLFDDRTNEPLLNQAIVTFERALDPQACCTDWGFKAQFMYGSDSRYCHNLGFIDNVTDSLVQPDVLELYATYHVPCLTEGGVDIKVGQFVTLMSSEVIYAPGNNLYSHSYAFNFNPFKHTGIMTTTHVHKGFDLMLGIVNGVNTGSFDDNNDDLSFHGGFMWKPCGDSDQWIINGSAHIGPENDTIFDGVLGTDVSDDNRYIVNLVSTYQHSECVTLITDAIAGWDEGFGGSEWYGISQSVVYKMSDCCKLVARGEIYRDDDGFTVAKFGDNDDAVDLLRGDFPLDAATAGGGDTTFTALTFGVNVKPYENLLLRPEIRWDWADGGALTAGPFDDLSDNNSFTIGMDAILFF
jgi:hypothetical protein